MRLLKYVNFPVVCLAHSNLISIYYVKVRIRNLEHVCFWSLTRSYPEKGISLFYLFSFLICLPLRSSDNEHLFMCLLTICRSSLKKCLSKSSVHFQAGLFVFYFCPLQELKNIYILAVNQSLLRYIVVCHIFFPILQVAFPLFFE